MRHLLMHKKIANALFLTILVLAGFLFVKMISEIKAYSFIGGGVPITNTITVSGQGEVFAVPDIAQFTFSVTEEKETVALAQTEVDKKIDLALGLLKGANIEERDIKTISYNVYPQYDYIRSVCNEFNCPPGKQELRGYQVSQTISVKVRDTESAGKVLADIGGAGASNISGLNFTIDDEDELERDARRAAIDDAEEKARALARDLGVSLGRVVGFDENSYQPQFARSFDVAAFAEDEAIGGGIVPDLPVGENKITSNVNITYEIR